MNAADAIQSSDGEPWAPLVDMSRLPLTPLSAGADGIIGRSLRRVLDSLHDRDGVISAFSSAFPTRSES
jgi:FXSXX-COOH protein